MTTFQNATVNGFKLFYREAGSKASPTIVLLHGFPSSSHMFRDLIPLLADQYYLIAPDYPGFGYSSTPAIDAFEYTFDHVTDVIEQFTEQIGLGRYALYMQDFGGPIGLRLATRHPDRVTGLIVQNANAYEEGVTAGLRDVVLRVWTDHSAEAAAALRSLFELPATRRQFLEGAEDSALVNPDSWHHAQWGMDRPGNKEIQFALHSNYGSNPEHYDEWQRYFREHQPPTLVVWGKADFIFAEGGAHAYKKDLEKVELHLLDAGHFALETKASEIASYIRAFLGSQARETRD